MGLVGTVVDATVGWLVQSILGSFFTVQMEAWTREVGLADDVEKLKSAMGNVEMLLAAAAADGKRIGKKPLAWSLDDLNELLHDAEDVMDELDYYRFQQQIEGKNCSTAACTNPEGSNASSSTASFSQLVRSTTNRIISWASHDRKRKREDGEPTHNTMLPLEIKHDISERINGILNRLSSIHSSMQGVLQLISCPIALSKQSQRVARNTRLTTSIPIEDKVYGRDAQRDKIIEILINGKSSDLHVLPVVGIGGVGKTTLARFVYRDQRIKDHFDLRMWVCVSTNFDEVRLTREILEYVCKDRQEYENISNFNVLQDILLKNIRNKRFLLVLDDMWEYKDRSGWVKLLAPLKHNQVTGCMILATTRLPSVANMIRTMTDVKVNGLDEKEFWLFFKACAFGNENHEEHPILQSIGQQIAKALKGCPLAARSVGALLYTSVSFEHWRAVQDKWKSLQEEDDDILPILKLSYDYLPVHLQNCFSYCSLFPEDYHFNGEKLVRAWISQNFVQCEDRTMRLEETGQHYLDNLVDLGFFQKVDAHYVMHDLMHELAEKVSSNECATIHGLKSKAIRPSVRHLSIITTACDKNEHDSFPTEKFEKILKKIRPQKLRTLMLFGRSSINLLRVLHTLCKEAKCLRFLRICVTGADDSFIHNLLNDLNPCHLRYLEYICSRTAFPQVLTRFYHLQVLDVDTSGHLCIPAGMNNLVNLRHLIANEKVHCAIACIGNMTSLQELKFKVQNVGGFEIRQLQSMNELVTLGISQLQNVKTKEEAGGVRLIDKEYLEKLSLSWDDRSMSPEPKRTEDVLEGLQPHQNLKTLEITGYSGATPPTWLSSNFSVTSLQILCLENCRKWRILPSLNMLPFLRKLILIRMQDLMEISIPSLEELVLIDMPKLEKCFGTYGMNLTSRLRVLMIKSCSQLNEFTPFQSYSSFEAEQKSWFPSLNKLSIWHCPHIMWEILPLREMGALKELELMDMHVVRELSVPSLEKLVLIKMPSLESCSGLTAPPPLPFSPSQGEQKEWLSSLRKLTIRDCSCLIVSHPLPPSPLISVLSIKGVSTFPTMKLHWRSLGIESNELSVLDDKTLAFHNLTGITSLHIQNCPKLISLSSEGFSKLTALEHLWIDNCPNLLKSHIMSEAVEENSTSASSFVFPSLKFLGIQSCGIAGRWLTQMLPRVQSLETLVLSNCPQIKLLSISQPTETEGTSSSASADTSVMSSGQDEQLLKMPYNILLSLKDLRIYRCPDMEFCGGKGSFGRFTSLLELVIDGCPKLVWSLVGETKDDGSVDIGLLPPPLQNLQISPLPAILQSYVPEGLLHLKKLRLSSSPYLKSVQLHSFTSLEGLAITGCKHLAALEGLQFLCSLRRLEIEMNPELSSAWDLKVQEEEQSGNQIRLFPPLLNKLVIWNLTDNVQSPLLSCLPPIMKLAIRKSPELTSLQLGYCTALKKLKITNCGSLVSIEGFQSTRNLTSLMLYGSPSLPPCLELESHQEGVPAIWSRLETLVIDDSSVLSVQLGYCTALKKLKITNCGSLVSIEGFQSTRNLTSLMLYGSPSLPPCLELESHQEGVPAIWSRLETLVIDDFSVLSISLCKQLTSLRYLRFQYWGNTHTEGTVSLTEEQERAFELLISLQELRLAGWPNLLSLPANLYSLTSLDSLYIVECPSIARLPEMGLPPSLRCLMLFRCSEELGMQCRMATTEKLSVTIDDERVN